MTRAATMGTSSCATIAIAHFKGENKAWNEAYKTDKSDIVQNKNGDSVKEFYDNTIFPTSQPLGHTREYGFQHLMDLIDGCGLSTKFITATLNASQYNLDDKYWPKELESRGFKLFDVTDNTIGQRCYVYVRNNNRPSTVEVGECKVA